MVISVRCARDSAEAVRERLLQISGGRGTWEEETGDCVLIRAYASLDRDWVSTVARLADQLAAVRKILGDVLIGAPVAQVITDEDWAEAWKAHYEPVVVGRVVVKPSWCGLPEDVPAEAVVVELDPQMAFGTGTHATTQLALLAIQEVLRPGDRVADVGTGTGILAIAAALLGAQVVYATDNDPLAVAAARQNAARNGVQAVMRVEEAEYLDGVPGGLDLVVANISPVAIAELSQPAAEHLRAGGYFVCTGFTKASEREVRDALEAEGFVEVARRVEEQWVCLSLLKP
ncbi:MAG: 50S ribosomal protein L11 methyltransferase [Armatimonadetes bacterium]|nr:50S ribosomal protein L11 methyltransferase [Armatimonadota bacterium]